MKLSCSKENLSKGLDIVKHAVATRAVLPILSNILLAAEGGRLKLSATNLESGLTCWIDAQVEMDGATTLPARTLVDLVKELPSGPVDIELDPATQTTSLKCGRLSSRLRGIDAAEFPVLPGVSQDRALHVDPAALRQAIRQVVFAAATDEGRPILTGVLFRFYDDSDQGKVTLAAADGFRLAVREVPLTEPVPEPVDVIVPARALALLARISGEQENPVALSVTPSGTQAVFRLDRVELVTQLIDRSFPDYAQVVPKTTGTRVQVQVSEFLKACKAASVFARDAKNAVRMIVAPGNDVEPGGVVLQAVSAETGDNVGHVDAAVEGAPIQIAFNVKYLIDQISAVGTQVVAIELTTPSTPGIFRPVEGQDAYYGVIMPLHLA